MTYLTDKELRDGASAAASAWEVAKYSEQLQNETEPRVACDFPGPLTHPIRASGEEG